jgi:hypothetical protein
MQALTRLSFYLLPNFSLYAELPSSSIKHFPMQNFQDPPHREGLCNASNRLFNYLLLKVPFPAELQVPPVCVEDEPWGAHYGGQRGQGGRGGRWVGQRVPGAAQGRLWRCFPGQSRRAFLAVVTRAHSDGIDSVTSCTREHDNDIT